jgi:TPR repeat protein
MYHLATFPEFLSEPFKSPLSNPEAWRWLLRAAEGGCAQAQRDAGASLATGDWREVKVPQDLAAAIAWYRRAAEAGHADAQYNLASMLADGEGCDRDLPAAREWLRRAVAGGYEYAEGLLAQLDSLQQSLITTDTRIHLATQSWRSTVRNPRRRCWPRWLNTDLRTSQRSQVDFGRLH